jgi:hypothetical protein
MDIGIKIVLTIFIVLLGIFLYDDFGDTLGYGKYLITGTEAIILVYIWRWFDMRKKTK